MYFFLYVLLCYVLFFGSYCFNGKLCWYVIELSIKNFGLVIEFAVQDDKLKTKLFILLSVLYAFGYFVEFASEQGGLSADVIKKAFNATEEDFTRLVKQSLPLKPQIASVGSCCLVGAISGGELYVANLGDSRAVLGRRGFDGEHNSVVAERLSSDHNVSCENVRREVEALHPDDSPIVVYYREVWRIKGIIQVILASSDSIEVALKIALEFRI